MTTVGRRILYLRSLNIDREQFLALLLPFLDNPPTSVETVAWYESGLLPKRLE